jgi:hypothetical protein
MPESDHAAKREMLVNAAIRQLYDAMIAFSQQHGTLTGWEWMRVFGEVQAEFWDHELGREWARPPR